jgi:hypothetical protein
MTAAQKLAWEHRRINSCIATVVDLRHWFTQEQLNTILTNLNAGINEIEGKQKKAKKDEEQKPRVAKKWSDT